MNEEHMITIYQGEMMPASEMSIEEAMIAKWLQVTADKSQQTKDAYTSVIKKFRALLQERNLDVFSDPRLIASVASDYAKTSYDKIGRVKTGRLSESTINQRLAILSSFYCYVLEFHDYLNYPKNPIKLCKREKRNIHDAAIHLEADDAALMLARMPRVSLADKRNYALLVLAITTGRRAKELTALTWQDLRFAGKKLEVTWQHCKGNKTMQDTLGAKTREALESWLIAFYGSLARLPKDAPIFVSLSPNSYGRAMSTQTVGDVCEKYLGTSKAHVTRHTFAVNLEQAGASLSEIGEHLGHNDLKVTSEYMKRRHAAENKHINELEALYGL